jgi:hypothetical protein
MSKRGLGTAVQAMVIALAIAVAMTVCACLASLNPRADNPTTLQTVLFVLNFPALIVWMGSGPEHDQSGIIFRVFVFTQWVVLGGAIGFLVTLIRRTMKKA